MPDFSKCRHCEDRYVGCHSECEYYKHDKKENDKAKAYLKSFDDADVELINRRAELYRKSRKNRRYSPWRDDM